MEDEMDLEESESVDVLQLVCFMLANEQYAINIKLVQEVIRVQKITPVPQMPKFVIGVMNIRGQIVPIFDLREKFHLEKKKLDGQTKILVINVKDSLIGIIVDDILDNIKIEQKNVDPAPNIKMQIEKECVKGLGMLDERMIIILDVDRIDEVICSDIENFRKGKVVQETSA